MFPPFYLLDYCGIGDDYECEDINVEMESANGIQSCDSLMNCPEGMLCKTSINTQGSKCFFETFYIYGGDSLSRNCVRAPCTDSLDCPPNYECNKISKNCELVTSYDLNIGAQEPTPPPPPPPPPRFLCAIDSTGEKCGQFGDENACRGKRHVRGNMYICSNNPSDKIPCPPNYRITEGAQGLGCYQIEPPTDDSSPQPPKNRCIDTDANEDYPWQVPGYVSSRNEFEKDTCFTNYRIIEKSCSADGSIKSTNLPCRQGYSCHSAGKNSAGAYCSRNPSAEEQPSELEPVLCPSNILNKNCGQFESENACRGTRIFYGFMILCSDNPSDKIPCPPNYRIREGAQGWGCYPPHPVKPSQPPTDDSSPQPTDDSQVSEDFCNDHTNNFLCLGLGYKQILELCKSTPNSPICIDLVLDLNDMNNLCASSPDSAICNGGDNVEAFCRNDADDQLCQIGLLMLGECLENNICLELTTEEKNWFCSMNSNLSFCRRETFVGGGLPDICGDQAFINVVGDDDGDGIADSYDCDRCIDTPMGSRVDGFGCADGDTKKRSSKKTCEGKGGIYCGSLSCPQDAVEFTSEILGDPLRDGGTCCIPSRDNANLVCSAQVFNPLSSRFVSVTESACNDPDGDGIGTKTVTHGMSSTQEPCTTISAKAKNAPVPFFSNIHIIFTLLILGSFYIYKKAKKTPSLSKKENK